MIEIEYIPMKTPDGQTAGHARVQGGFVDVRLKRNDGGQALVLTDTGYVSGSPDARIRAGGLVTAVAVHTAGSLACVGFGRAGAMTLADVRRRVAAITEASAAHPPRVQVAPAAAVSREAPPAAPEQAAHVFGEAEPQSARFTQAAPVAAPEAPCDADAEAEVIPMRRSARHVPAGNEVKRALDRLAQPADAAFFPAEAPEKRSEPRILPAFADDGDDERAAAFAALLARADAVFRRISDPFEDDDSAPLPFRPHPDSAPSPAPAPAERSPEAAPASLDLDAWSRAVDDILAETPAPAAHDIDNPFPHIFPDACFTHRGDLYGDETLMGEWARGNDRFTITAVRGDYSPEPPATLPGFTRYIRTLQGGFWVRVEDAHAFSERKDS